MSCFGGQDSYEKLIRLAGPHIPNATFDVVHPENYLDYTRRRDE